MTDRVQILLPRPLLEVTLSFPPKELMPNALRRLHHQARARITKPYREEAGWVWRSQRLPAAALEVATARAVFYQPDRRRRDPDNLLLSLKPVWDGARDAGVLIDDDELYHLPVVKRVDRENPRVEISLWAGGVEYLARSKNGAENEIPSGL